MNEETVVEQVNNEGSCAEEIIKNNDASEDVVDPASVNVCDACQ